MTDQQMDETVARYRLMTESEFHEAIATSPEFKLAIEAAYKRANFTNVDRDGWSRTQYNVRIPPAQPNVRDPFGPGAKDKEESLKPIPGAMLF